MLRTRRFHDDGFFDLDEPEAGLAFTHQPALVGALVDAVRETGPSGARGHPLAGPDRYLRHLLAD